MKIVSALMFLFGVAILAFTIVVSWQFGQIARSSNPEAYPLAERMVEILVPYKESNRDIQPARIASQFNNRLMLIGAVGAMMCALAAFVWVADGGESRRATANPKRG